MDQKKSLSEILTTAVDEEIITQSELNEINDRVGELISIKGQRITAVVVDEVQDFDPEQKVLGPEDLKGIVIESDPPPLSGVQDDEGVDYGFINIEIRPRLGVAIQFLGGEASAKMIQSIFDRTEIVWKLERHPGQETWEFLQISDQGGIHPYPGDWLVSIHGTTRIEVFVDQEFRSLYRLREKVEPAELAIPFAIYKSFPEDGTRRTTSWLS